MKFFQPMLFSTIKNYKQEQLLKDVISGIIVAIIALPLSIALSLASGASPEIGIYTAIIGGFVIGFFGGSAVQISGPTAAFANIVASIIAQYGMDGLAVITIMAGLILVLMGLFKIGSLIKFIPQTITIGFTSGIAVTIFIGQLKDFFGINYANAEKPIEAIEKLELFIHYFNSFNPYAVILGLVCLFVLIVWQKLPKAFRKIPASLVAVLVGVLVSFMMSEKVNTIGDLYTISNSLPSFHLPEFNFDLLGVYLPQAITVAVLAGVESLLSCVVADEMSGTKHRSNTELIGQGLGNIACGMFGALPATGAIARTTANVNNGAKTPISALVHSLVLLLILVVLMPYAAFIPMPAISAILFIVAYNMSCLKSFVRLLKIAPKSDIIVMLLTFSLTVIFDLVVAIQIGLLLACILFMKRMSEQIKINSWKYLSENEQDDKLINLPKYIRVYEINGPLFFASTSEISKIKLKKYTNSLIIRMGAVISLDITAFYAIEKLFAKCKEQNVNLVFSHVNPQVMSVFTKSGFIDEIGKENICPKINAAIERCENLYKSNTKN